MITLLDYNYWYQRYLIHYTVYSIHDMCTQCVHNVYIYDMYIVYMISGITLRSTTSKLFQMVVLERILEGLGNAMRENHSEFRKNYSCVDQIFFLRGTIEYKLPYVQHCFIDFNFAFDCVNRNFTCQAFSSPWSGGQICTCFLRWYIFVHLRW